MTRSGPRSRLLPILLLLGALLVAAVLTLPWLWAEHRLQAELARWEADRLAEGWDVRHGTPVREGWPLAAALALPEVTLSAPPSVLPGGLAWSAPSLRVSVSLLHPATLALEVAGAQRLRLALLPELAVAAGRMTASVPIAAPAPGPGWAPVRIAAAGLAVGLPAAPPVRAGQLELTLAPGPVAAPLAFTLVASEVVLPPGRPWPLGPVLASLTADGALQGALAPPPGAVFRSAAGPSAGAATGGAAGRGPGATPGSAPGPRPGGAPGDGPGGAAAPPSAAAQAIGWRDDGGRVVLSRVQAAWGPLDVTGSASLTLDDLLQPAGSAELRLTGWSEALDAMVAGGTMPGGVAVAARAVLGLMARTPEGGGPSVVALPLLLQERTLSAGHIPLLRLPALAWPGAPPP